MDSTFTYSASTWFKVIDLPFSLAEHNDHNQQTSCTAQHYGHHWYVNTTCTNTHTHHFTMELCNEEGQVREIVFFLIKSQLAYSHSDPLALSAPCQCVSLYTHSILSRRQTI